MKMFQPLLVPVLTQMALTFVIWCWLMLSRLQSMKRHRVKMQDLATDTGYQKISDTENVSENFSNQFELPVIFYALMILVMFTYQTDSFYLYGAWIFVFSRAAHSMVHCTVNHILTRFIFHSIGVVALFAMILRFIYLNRFIR